MLMDQETVEALLRSLPQSHRSVAETIFDVTKLMPPNNPNVVNDAIAVMQAVASGHIAYLLAALLLKADENQRALDAIGRALMGIEAHLSNLAKPPTY
jgi:hypothetical protein